MDDRTQGIADTVRGVAAEKRFTQQRIAKTLGISRQSVSDRLRGRIPFSATEILTLADEMGEPIARFFPRHIVVERAA